MTSDPKMAGSMMMVRQPTYEAKRDKGFRSRVLMSKYLNSSFQFHEKELFRVVTVIDRPDDGHIGGAEVAVVVIIDTLKVHPDDPDLPGMLANIHHHKRSTGVSVVAIVFIAAVVLQFLAQAE